MAFYKNIATVVFCALSLLCAPAHAMVPRAKALGRLFFATPLFTIVPNTPARQFSKDIEHKVADSRSAMSIYTRGTLEIHAPMTAALCMSRAHCGGMSARLMCDRLRTTMQCLTQCIRTSGVFEKEHCRQVCDTAQMLPPYTSQKAIRETAEELYAMGFEPHYHETLRAGKTDFEPERQRIFATMANEFEGVEKIAEHPCDPKP